MNNDVLRKHLVYLLKGDGAHVDFDAAVKDFPAALCGKKPNGSEHSPWEVLEHLRIAQWDILEYLQNPKHVSPEFPAGYWPKAGAPKNGKDWDRSAESFRKDLQVIVELVNSPKTDLLAVLPGTEDQTIARKVMMLADHNSYHLGEMVLVRRLLGAWNA